METEENNSVEPEAPRSPTTPRRPHLEADRNVVESSEQMCKLCFTNVCLFCVVFQLGGGANPSPSNTEPNLNQHRNPRRSWKAFFLHPETPSTTSLFLRNSSRSELQRAKHSEKRRISARFLDVQQLWICGSSNFSTVQLFC